MNDYTIPAWFVWVVSLFCGLFIPWSLWATLQIFRNDKVIALTRQSLATTGEDVKKLDVKFDKMDAKMDLFLAQEIGILKQLAHR